LPIFISSVQVLSGLGLSFSLPVVDSLSLWPGDLCPSVPFGRGLTIALSLTVGGLLGPAGVNEGVLFLTKQKAVIGQRPAHLHLIDVEVLAGAVLHWNLLNYLNLEASLALGCAVSAFFNVSDRKSTRLNSSHT